jgi:outer membrane immunogenic protein
MRYFSIATISVISAMTLSQAAFAADMAVKAPPPEQPPPAPIYTWTGCYVGGNGGAAWTDLRFHQNGTVGGPAVSADYGHQNDTSPIIGVQVGCDYQAGPWVFGGRGQTEFTDLNQRNSITAAPAFYMTAVMRNVTTATGRIGYTIAPQLLLYGQGGGAWVHDDLNVYAITAAGGVPSEGASSVRSGWVAGAGLEWMYSPNWSVFIEYNYMDFGTTNVNFIAAPGTVGFPGIIGVRQTVQTAMAGVNWRFWSGGGWGTYSSSSQ